MLFHSVVYFSVHGRARAEQADVDQIVMCRAGVTCGGNLGEKVGDARTGVLFSFFTV